MTARADRAQARVAKEVPARKDKENKEDPIHLVHRGHECPRCESCLLLCGIYTLQKDGKQEKSEGSENDRSTPGVQGRGSFYGTRSGLKPSIGNSPVGASGVVTCGLNV